MTGPVDQAVRAWDEDGFTVLPGFLTAADLAAARDDLPRLFPTADEFHDGVDPARNARFRDEAGGIDTFPFAAPSLSLLALHPRLVALAAALLRTDDLRLVSAEARAAYTGAGGHEQPLRRDYLDHTPLVPSDDPGFKQVELVVYLSDVTEAHGPPRFVPRPVTAGAPAWPDRLGPEERPEWSRHERPAPGPAGTVVAREVGTFHRSVRPTAPRGARYTLHVGARPAAADWGVRHGWAVRSREPDWYRFVERATHRQLALVGFPPPEHPYWTHQTLRGMAERYPRLDLTRWAHRVSEARDG